MDLKEEFKKEMQALAPSEEQAERIRAGVMKKLAESNLDAPDISAKKKKPLYLKIAAVSGTAVCAAVLIVVFTGLRHGIFLESADHAGGNFISNQHSFGNANAPNAPNYDDSLAGGAGEYPDIGMEGASTADGNMSDNIQSPSMESPGAAQSTGGPGFSNFPSISGTPSGSDGNGGQNTGTSQSAPYLKFSEDSSVCDVTRYGETVTYRRYEGYVGGENTAEPLQPAYSDIDTELFVQFDNDIMVVFYSDGTVFRAYIKK